MDGNRLRSLRETAGLTQGELAQRAGVSRQLVGAVETGRHLPRVDAALALAAVLGVDAAVVFERHGIPADVVSGQAPIDGALVRVGRVGERTVTSPARVGPAGWDVADGVVEAGRVTPLDRSRPGVVVAGCEPGLEVLERLLREGGMGAVAVTASTVSAVGALGEGRAHAAVVHGPDGRLPQVPEGVEVTRFRLARWRVGLAGPPDATAGWWEPALGGRVSVVQREPGAGAQSSFEDAAGGAVPGPRVGSHVEAARLSVATRMAAVTIEPAALAMGALFHPLDLHHAEMWVAEQWLGERAVDAALSVVSGKRFQRRLEGVGGYELAGCGTRAA